MGAAIQHYGLTHLTQVPARRPPVGDQTEIAAFMDRELNKLDSLSLEAERAVSLLQERRSAVTGQIDVRGTMPSSM
jgi:type I restriction enzyme S subunit